MTTVLAAYAFARLNFPGKKIMLSLMLATLMIPGEMLIITNFITITKLKWINTYQAMIVPYLASVFYIYLLTQFFSQVPDALYLAAKVDKCNDFKYLIKIMIPINKSPITTVCILNAIGCWNSFMWPLLVTNSKEMRVLSYGLMQFQTENGSSYELIMAASCILVLPIVVDLPDSSKICHRGCYTEWYQRITCCDYYVRNRKSGFYREYKCTI